MSCHINICLHTVQPTPIATIAEGRLWSKSMVTPKSVPGLAIVCPSGNKRRPANLLSGSSLFQIVLELWVDVKAVLLRQRDLPIGLVQATGLHIDHGEVVVGLAEFRIRTNGVLPFSLGLIPVTGSEKRAAKRKQHLGRRME
jgi:hypothetical protein